MRVPAPVVALISPWRTRAKIARLTRHPSPLANAVGQALHDIVTDHFSAEEREAIERIEALRTTMANSSERLAFYYEGGTVKEKTVGDICRGAAQPRRWAGLLFKLLRHARPNNCLEMGTSLGISAAYQAAALELNQRGRFLSLEGAPTVAQRAAANLQLLGLFSRASIQVGRFEQTLEPAVRERAPIDYAFIDGHHDERATLAYLNVLIPFLAQPALMVFDDINWTEGMVRAWQAIQRDRRLAVTVQLSKLGIAVFDPACASRLTLTIHL